MSFGLDPVHPEDDEPPAEPTPRALIAACLAIIVAGVIAWLIYLG